MRGIILAGGTGSRLHPITLGISKQLTPVYDKPMIYYPLSTLMLAGIREILVNHHSGRSPTRSGGCLATGGGWGIGLTYADAGPARRAGASVHRSARITSVPEPVALVLGDNIFYGPGLGSQLIRFADIDGGAVFAYRVVRSLPPTG